MPIDSKPFHWVKARSQWFRVCWSLKKNKGETCSVAFRWRIVISPALFRCKLFIYSHLECHELGKGQGDQWRRVEFTWRELKRQQTMRRWLPRPIPYPLLTVWHQNKWKTTQPAKAWKKIERYSTFNCKINISITCSTVSPGSKHFKFPFSRGRHDWPEHDWAHESPLKRSSSTRPPANKLNRFKRGLTKKVLEN